MGAALTQVIGLQEASDAAILGIEHSVSGRRWVPRLDPARECIADAIAQQNGLPEILGRVLAARGAEPQTAADFLNPTLRSLLPDPMSLQDMKRAASRFAEAISTGEPIAVFGDYDVDGAVSIALVQRFLRAHGQAATHYVPDRLTEGYGPSTGAMSGLAAEGAKLILTVDCGTSAYGPIRAANSRGAEVIVLDHHQAGEELPEALAVVNPNREDDISGQGHLAAAGVVFLFLVAVARTLREAGYYSDRPEPDLMALLDLVALATVCDVVPLKGVNRAFVTQGLKVLRLRRNAGLRALADAARLDQPPDAYALGFILGPRINAGGRTGFPALGAKLLCTDDDIEARRLAERLDLLNAERRAIEDRVLEEAISLADAALLLDVDAPFLCLGGDGWHKGLLGLVSSRITERFGRPSLVIGWDGEDGTGSARSIPAIDLGRAIRKAVEQGHLTRGGGHAMAAGFSLQRAALTAFGGFLQQEFAVPFAASHAARNLRLDGALSAGGVNNDLAGLLERAGPYGAGHPRPRFAFAHHRLSRIRLMKETHIRCTLTAPDGSHLEACAFRSAETPVGRLLLVSEGSTLHVAGHLRSNCWQGRQTIELIVEDAADPRRA